MLQLFLSSSVLQMRSGSLGKPQYPGPEKEGSKDGALGIIGDGPGMMGEGFMCIFGEGVMGMIGVAGVGTTEGATLMMIGTSEG